MDDRVAAIAAAIGEPARARILFCLMDRRARTSTELALVAEVSPSTASVHLNRLRDQRLIRVQAQGKHRYYSLESTEVANVLEGLAVLAGGTQREFVPNTPSGLRAARTCYDHIAGRLGVAMHDRLALLGWLATVEEEYEVTPKGMRSLEAMGVDIAAARTLRRRFAFGCVDWSERRPHIGGAVGAALLEVTLKRKWVTQELDSRVLCVTSYGRHEMARHFGLEPRNGSWARFLCASVYPERFPPAPQSHYPGETRAPAPQAGRPRKTMAYPTEDW